VPLAIASTDGIIETLNKLLLTVLTGCSLEQPAHKIVVAKKKIGSFSLVKV
jgi:hypothetical protein